MSSAVAEPTPNPDLTPNAPSSSPYRAAVLAKVTTPVPGLVLERVCQARVCHAPLEWALSVCPRHPRCYRRPVGGDISTWVRLLRSNWGERVGPGGSELWAGAKVISKEARRGGETKIQMARPGGAGVRRLGTRAPTFAFSKGSSALRPFLFALEVSFFIEVPSHPHWSIPGPCPRLQTGQDSKSGPLVSHKSLPQS